MITVLYVFIALVFILHEHNQPVDGSFNFGWLLVILAILMVGVDIFSFFQKRRQLREKKDASMDI
jgi:hypothetical protein